MILSGGGGVPIIHPSFKGSESAAESGEACCVCDAAGAIIAQAHEAIIAARASPGSAAWRQRGEWFHLNMRQRH